MSVCCLGGANTKCARHQMPPVFQDSNANMQFFRPSRIGKSGPPEHGAHKAQAAVPLCNHHTQDKKPRIWLSLTGQSPQTMSSLTALIVQSEYVLAEQ